MAARRAVRGMALFENDEAKAQLRKVDPCAHAPPHVLAHAERFRYMLDRDPVTGSFSDYREWLGDRTDVVGNFHGNWTDFITHEEFSV